MVVSSLKYLHSTMYLLKPDAKSGTDETKNKFTFHHVSIKTYV